MITVNSREDFLRQLKALLPDSPFCVEIGVYRGEFSRMILDIIKPNFLQLIDPFEKNDEKYGGDMDLTTAYSGIEDYEQVRQLCANEIKEGIVAICRNYSYNEVKTFPDGIADMVYIDASHLYKDVKQDLNDWLPKITGNGLLCGHDYVSLDNFGVIEAVNEFMREHKFEMILFNANGGDWALRKTFPKYSKFFDEQEWRENKSQETVHKAYGYEITIKNE